MAKSQREQEVIEYLASTSQSCPFGGEIFQGEIALIPLKGPAVHNVKGLTGITEV